MLELKFGVLRSTMGIGGRSTPFSHHGVVGVGWETFWAGKETPKCTLGGENKLM